MRALDSVQAKADYEAKRAHDFVFFNQAANAREIAESVPEPEILIEQIVLAVNGNGSVSERYSKVESLMSAAARDYANKQAEAAHTNVMLTPS